MSDDWYPALQRSNVELVDKPTVQVLPDGFHPGGAVRKVRAIVTSGDMLDSADFTAWLKRIWSRRIAVRQLF